MPSGKRCREAKEAVADGAGHDCSSSYVCAAPAGLWGVDLPAAAPPLASRHTLPTSGNWVRLSAAEQHEVTSKAARARRAGLEARAAACEPPPPAAFGSEPRLSASRRWAHQANSDVPFTRGRGGSAHGSGGTTVGAKPGRNPGPNAPGSFLPLKAFASRLH